MMKYKGRFRKGAYIIDYKCPDSSCYNIGTIFEQKRGNKLWRYRVVDIENEHRIIVVPLEICDQNQENSSFSESSPHKPWDMYSFGYKFAADILKERIDSNTVPWPTVFPCSFLYLHSIELIIKGLILQGNIALGIPYSPSDIETDHNIQGHWKTAREIMSKLWPDTDQEDLDLVTVEVNKLNSEIYELMRYPVDTSGALKDIPPAFFIERRALPILQKLADDLESLDTAIYEEKINS